MATISNWSNLPEDLIRSIFERLNYIDFHRARAVCSNWYRVYGECVPKRVQVPWVMSFPYPAQTKRSLVMYNLQGDCKISKIQDLGVDPCLANCGSWFLMSDPRSNLYILNVLTMERTKLPPIEYQHGQLLLKRKGDNRFSAEFCHSSLYTERMGETNGFKIRKAALWRNEETGDYAVAWNWGINGYVTFTKKGDSIWRQISPFVTSVDDLVYKNNKLYAYTKDLRIRITDFSTKLPAHVYIINPPRDLSSLVHGKTKIAVTKSGDVLLVVTTLECDDMWRFKLYKYELNSNVWSQCFSLGGEALMFDLGTTLVASNVRGIIKNSIYYSDGTHVSVYEISTRLRRSFSSYATAAIPFWIFPTS